MSDWETVALERLIEADRGISYGVVQPGAHAPDGIPIIRVSDVRNGRIATTAPLRVSSAIESAHSRTRLRGGELLLTLVGTVGEAAVVPESLAGWNVARAVAVIPVRKDVGAYWVQAALRAPVVREVIGSRLNTTVQATLNLGDVARLPIVMPPRREREAIAHILGTLDDKIELNRRTNETLEAIARALFRSWFVDFDPVRAKAEGRDTGLPKEIADLFPDSFEDSELGEIPKGWETGALDRLARLSAITSKPASEPDHMWEHYSIPAFDEGRRPKRELGAEIKSNKYRVPRTSVLVSKLNPQFPRIWLPEVRDEAEAICSTEFMPFVPATPAWRPWLYALATSSTFQAEIVDRVTGSTGSRQRVTPSEIATLPIVLPPTELIERFSEAIEPALAQGGAMLRESATLAELRDALLPKLISGALRLRHDGVPVKSC